MSLVRYKGNGLTPFRSFGDGFFDDVFDIFEMLDPVRRSERTPIAPKITVDNTEDGHSINMAVPGISKDDLKVDVEDKRLTISFDEENSENSNYRFQRSFTRSWNLPENIDLQKVSADYDNGILTVNIPNLEPTEPSSRRIAVG